MRAYPQACLQAVERWILGRQPERSLNRVDLGNAEKLLYRTTFPAASPGPGERRPSIRTKRRAGRSAGARLTSNLQHSKEEFSPAADFQGGLGIDSCSLMQQGQPDRHSYKATPHHTLFFQEHFSN
jgi:hypothetical protein